MESSNGSDEITLITTSSIETSQLYNVLIPLIGIFVISLNLLVVISSGLILKTRKLSL